jgi:predicted nucleic acid-binding protein
MVYIDSSALAKLYVIEPESAAVERWLRASTPYVATSRVTYAEILSALVRCLKDGRISAVEYRLQKKAFLADWSALNVVELSSATLASADRLIERHGLRGSDAIHLCSALWIGKPAFACFDQRLRSAAAAEGLPLAP